jgi:hypothetical protein
MSVAQREPPPLLEVALERYVAAPVQLAVPDVEQRVADVHEGLDASLDRGLAVL